ncbi:hypothetical protein NPIL_454771 [Nephila pilipes]|uniref:Uncharacterized protein n=1 Tax=Nephila pilipes TaxID=299642 RepID=A0A8X6PV38_NEPPI|nr:hypothetical protein NPIL_454771 [Nephila pilipes]
MSLLPLAKIKIKTKRCKFYIKAAIKLEDHSEDPYFLGNQPAEVIDSSEHCKQFINSVATRSAGEIHPTAVEKEIIARGQIESPLNLVSMSEGKEIRNSTFEGGKEIILDKINGSEFDVEKKKCKNLKVLWDKARTGVDKRVWDL